MDTNTTLEVVFKDTGGELKTKSVTYANAEKDNTTLATFVNKMAALTTNTVESITRVDKQKIG